MNKSLTAWIITIFILIGVASGMAFARYFPTERPGNYQGQVSSEPLTTQSPSPSPRSLTEELEVAEPQTISIPKISVNAAVELVGNDSEGKMDVPKGVFNVGWYSLGTKPGEKGSAVMAGHLDTVTGAPAVFYYLTQLQLGDEVIVTDKNGRDLTFEVTEMKSYPFDQVPLQQVFAAQDKPRLNLVTCTGTWNAGSANYSNRLVVYTELRS